MGIIGLALVLSRNVAASGNEESGSHRVRVHRGLTLCVHGEVRPYGYGIWLGFCVQCCGLILVLASGLVSFLNTGTTIVMSAVMFGCTCVCIMLLLLSEDMDP